MTRPRPCLIDLPLDELDKVVDGDTIHAWVRLNRDDTGWRSIRILDVVGTVKLDTPEEGEVGYAAAGDFVRGWLTGRTYLRVATRTPDSFGRWLGDVYDGTTGEHLDRAVIAHMRDTYGINPVYRQPRRSSAAPERS